MQVCLGVVLGAPGESRGAPGGVRGGSRGSRGVVRALGILYVCDGWMCVGMEALDGVSVCGGGLGSRSLGIVLQCLFQNSNGFEDPYKSLPRSQ